MISIIFIIIIAILVLSLFGKTKFSKSEIATFYGVSRKTFNKWLSQSTRLKGLNKQLADSKRRKLTVQEAAVLMFKLGFPNGKNCLTKGKLLDLLETDYKTLKENIILNQAKLKLSLNAKTGIDKFPPRVSDKILLILG